MSESIEEPKRNHFFMIFEKKNSPEKFPRENICLKMISLGSDCRFRIRSISESDANMWQFVSSRYRHDSDFSQMPLRNVFRSNVMAIEDVSDWHLTVSRSDILSLRHLVS